MSRPTISVIIPIYKVEPYLRQCLDSVVGQTYQELEIILVDDGSPDGCPAICDEYARQDSRIRVIHQENGGVSAARNAGLDAATGDWIGWVDPDDWIEADMYAYLLENALTYGADIVVCGRVERYPDRDVVWAWEKVEVWDQEQAVSRLLEDKALGNYLPEKLWRRELFEGIRFPVGEIFEDIRTVCHLFLKARRFVALPEVKYNYRQRPDSIVKARSFSQQLSYTRAVMGQMEALAPVWPQYKDRMAAQCVAAALGLWMTFGAVPRRERAQYQGELEKITHFVGQHRQTVLEHREVGLAGRLILRLIPYGTWWSFKLARVIGWLYEARHAEGI